MLCAQLLDVLRFALRRLAGVEGVYPNKPLRYFSDHTATAQNPKLPPLPGQAPNRR